MQRLTIAQQQIRSYMNDRLYFRGCGPHEVDGLAKLREALALISEAQLAFGMTDTYAKVQPRSPLTPVRQDTQT